MSRLLFFAVLLSSCCVAAASACTVASIQDGDSLRVRCSDEPGTISVRLAQIDAPELDQAHGDRSRDFLRFICPVGMEVRVQSDGTDQRGRVRGTMICNNINANVAMVLGGHAWASGRHGPASDLYKIQKRARANHMGLWQSADPIDPWEFRQTVR